jgi:hypothetical protein
MMVPASAYASGGGGIATYLMGIPLLLVVAIALGIVSARKPTRKAKLVSTLVFLPTLLFSLYLFPDALALLHDGPRIDSEISYGFLALLAIVCCQFAMVAWPAALYVLSWSDFVRRNGDGEVILDSRQLQMRPAPGTALWGPPLADHSVTNVGDSLLHVIAIELKPTGSG